VTVSGREVEKRLAENGVIRDLHRASVLENQKRRRQRRIRLDGGSLFPHTFGAVCGWSIFRRRYVRARAGTAAIEHGRTALVVCVVVGGFLLLVVRRGAFNCVGHRIRVPDWTANTGF
jgi:hypothetical protein